MQCGYLEVCQDLCGMLCILAKFCPSVFMSSLLLSRKRTIFCIIFTALLISGLLKLYEAERPLGDV